MKTKTITLTEDQWEKILDAAQSHQDQGPCPNGWQTPELTAAAEALDAAIKSEDSGQNSRDREAGGSAASNCSNQGNPGL